jgi:hypothetical protein
MQDRQMPRMHKYGKTETTRIMMPTVCHVTSSSGLSRLIFVEQRVQIQIKSVDKSGYKKIRHVNAITLITSNQLLQHYTVTAEVTDKIPYFHTSSSTNMGMI